MVKKRTSLARELRRIILYGLRRFLLPEKKKSEGFFFALSNYLVMLDQELTFRSHRRRVPLRVCTPERVKKKKPLIFNGFRFGGDSWTRTNDPIDVNDVLYRLSHATLYIFYDAYATFSRTIRPRQSGGR